MPEPYMVFRLNWITIKGFFKKPETFKTFEKFHEKQN